MNVIRLPGVAVEVNGAGVLIRGPSGSGKSYAALGLLDRGHRLISDDVVEIVRQEDGALYARPVEGHVRIEIRGLGVFRVDSLFPGGTAKSARLELVVELGAYNGERDSGRIKPKVESASILGREVRQVFLALPHGVDPALIIELLAKRVGRLGTVWEE